MEIFVILGSAIAVIGALLFIFKNKLWPAPPTCSVCHAVEEECICHQELTPLGKRVYE